ncbi:hypothetical protein [Paenibacillus sp. PL2-23]|uniref:hypothetical protein n=1 Tax=Paenibacillus sp. PL2-23 TaxID=2100729 RepID=UPI0030F8868B
MLIIGSFMHATELEMALSILEHNGIQPSRILVVPMSGSENVKSAIPAQTGTLVEKAFEISVATGTALGVIGTSVGFALRLGPLAWGLIYTIAGMALTFLAAYLLLRRKHSSPGKRRRQRAGRRPELTVMVECEEERAEWVSQILWRHEAMSVGRHPYEPS